MFSPHVFFSLKPYFHLTFRFIIINIFITSAIMSASIHEIRYRRAKWYNKEKVERFCEKRWVCQGVVLGAGSQPGAAVQPHQLGSRFVSQKMANKKNISKISINSEILCQVQHALEDLIVVTFSGPNNKVFQGVLLDSTKRQKLHVIK